MDGVQARQIFDLLVAAGYSPHLSATRSDGETCFEVSVDVDGMDVGLADLVKLGAESRYDTYPDRNMTLYFEAEGLASGPESEPARSSTNDG